LLQIVDASIVGGAVTAGLFIGILLLLELGRWLGARALARGGAAGLAGSEALQTAVFALLGLMIAFTFSGALNRFDTRRAQAVDEANAMGTAYLRIALLPASAQPALRELIRSYADARIATYGKLPDVAAAQAEVGRSQQLQNEIWKHAVAAVALPDATAGTNLLMMPALNEMFDLATTRLAATQMHPPMVIYAMLVGLALASALLAGYHAAGDRAHGWLHQVGFAAIIAFTVYINIDLEFPRLGWIRLDAIDQVLVAARASMN
jgi:hypothetical protein